MFEVEQLATIGEAGEEEWDLLAGSNPLSSYGWLRSIEQTALSAQMRCYLLARDSSGIAAAFECGIEMSANSHASLDEVLFGRAAGIAKAACLHPFPALVVRNRLCRPGLPDEVRRSLDQILLEAVERMAREKRATICFRQVTHGDSTLVELLRAPSVPT